MGEAKRRIQLTIDSSRIYWEARIPALQKDIASLNKELENLTGDEPYYWNIKDKIAKYEKTLSRISELSNMSGKELCGIYKANGCIV